jgi:uncharacterized ion transporter superfamily protein YfcC
VTIATYVIPAGEYDMAEDEETGRSIAVEGTYHRIDQTPVTPFKMVMAIQEGMIDGSDIIFLIFLKILGFLTILKKVKQMIRENMEK